MAVDASVFRLDRDAQIAQVRQEARQACVAQGHVLGDWRHAGLVADDEAGCTRCGSRLFILYGSAALQPLVGARVFGTAYGQRCRVPIALRGVR